MGLPFFFPLFPIPPQTSLPACCTLGVWFIPTMSPSPAPKSRPEGAGTNNRIFWHKDSPSNPRRPFQTEKGTVCPPGRGFVSPQKCPFLEPPPPRVQATFPPWLLGDIRKDKTPWSSPATLLKSVTCCPFVLSPSQSFLLGRSGSFIAPRRCWLRATLPTPRRSGAQQRGTFPPPARSSPGRNPPWGGGCGGAW